MGLFSKKKHEEKTPSLPQLPKLPSLPSIQNFPEIEEENLKELHQLPTFPTNSLGEKFSQDTIKNAIGGKEEENEFQENSIITDPLEIESPMQDSPIPVPRTNIYQKKTISIEPIFIRIDKFEESLKIFEGVKEKVKEIEDLLKKTKELKIKEDKELSLWEMEIQELKKQIENVDKDIFSKIQ
jgi:hypothetical protein